MCLRTRVAHTKLTPLALPVMKQSKSMLHRCSLRILSLLACAIPAATQVASLSAQEFTISLPASKTGVVRRFEDLPNADPRPIPVTSRVATLVALSDLQDSEDSSASIVEPEELPSLLEDRSKEKERVDALFEDADAKQDDDDQDDEAEKNSDDTTAVAYPSELQQLPPYLPISIWDARRAALENNKDIRVIGYEPLEAAAEVDIESAAFDHVLTFDADAGKLDEQTASQLQARGVNIEALQTDFFTPQDDELGSLVVQKRLRSGGTVQYGYNADYNFFSPSGNFVTVNPAWLSRVTLKIEQPLFKGRGAAITLAPIETAQAEQQISEGEFNTIVHETLRDLEVAYWQAALTARSYQWILDASRRAFETLKREEELLEEGRGSRPDALQAEEQYRTIRSELSEAKADWGTASREVYRLLGTPRATQQGYVWAADTPPIESLLIDPLAAEGAVQLHPEYAAQSAAVHAAEIELRTAANALQPDLAVRFAYAFSGLAENLDDAIDIMVDRRYNNWTVGMVFRHPFGRRAELATIRQAHLALSREQATLEQIEHDLLYAFQEGYELARARLELYREQSERRKKAEDLLEAQRELYVAGRIDIYTQLRSERALLDARIGEAKALADAWTAASEYRYALGSLN